MIRIHPNPLNPGLQLKILLPSLPLQEIPVKILLLKIPTTPRNFVKNLSAENPPKTSTCTPADEKRHDKNPPKPTTLQLKILLPSPLLQNSSKSPLPKPTTPRNYVKNPSAKNPPKASTSTQKKDPAAEKKT
eukprot:Phypoly_transcript_14373.p2 GENE.Phypoly_transcript_14373~~Phypoly_transcript_14373.p2  ORF type:complete len:132 (+),score=27.80 Phypoly_transcript_14373:287-682(+)